MRYPLSSVTVAKGMVFAGSDDLLMMPVQCEAAGAGESAAIQSAPGLRATPNPARGWTLLRCTVSNAGKARAAIFDLSGRRVRILHDGDWEAGPHNLVWDGKDGRGRPVAAGVYNARVSTSHGSRSARIVMLR
jgi:hypothetical protein